MRTIVLAVGVLLIVPFRCATADDISLLEKYLPRNMSLQMAQSCQYSNPSPYQAKAGRQTVTGRRRMRVAPAGMRLAVS